MNETPTKATIQIGTRKEWTDLDVAGLDDIGWDINYPAVPEPGAAFFLVLAGVLACARRGSRGYN